VADASHTTSWSRWPSQRTIYAAGIAARTGAERTAPDVPYNVCKRDILASYEMSRLADLAGGNVVTLPSEQDWRHPELGPLLDKYLRGRPGVPTEHRLRALRLIENMTIGRNAVGYLTESLHGAGSPQAQRVVIRRLIDLEARKALARRLAGIPPEG
jgi:4-hydroxybutyryl-CoA dehydratase/vinylacetyl-CoA-Delta-isomerase